MNRNCRRILLIQPPYGDFTYPYHSLSYVAAPLKAANYEVEVIDLNILWFRSVFCSAQLRAWHEELAASVDLLQRRCTLTIGEQEEVARALRSMATCETLAPERAIEILRSQEFYDFPRYLWARGQVRCFEKLLTDLYPPYDFFSAFAVPPYEPNSSELVARAVAQHRLIADMTRLLGEHCHWRDYLFCGITFPFSAHLVPGLAVFRALRTLFPDAGLVAGGTAMVDIYKYKESADTLDSFRGLVDFFYIGEAETSVVRFADWCRGEEANLPRAVIDIAAPQPDIACRKVEYVSLGKANGEFVPHPWESAPPDYSWIDWSLYLAPEKRVNYSPSRGCFWNQCTFCDYGLNSGSPTAPSRTMEADACAAHLSDLVATGVHRVYLAVDAIAPKFLDALADELNERKLVLGWSTQFFLTRQFTPELLARLAQSGLCIASFGLESGSSRILELMGKGKNRVAQDLMPAFQSFRESGIGLQPLFFFGFPGETEQDRRLTVELLLSNADIFATISKGGLFSLLAGSIVAKEPERFGIDKIRRRQGEDISGDLEYESGDDPCTSEVAGFNDRLPHWNRWERPWAGGIDTLHTQLYVERFGRDVFRRLQEEHGEVDEPWVSIRVRSGFDLDQLMSNVILQGALKCPSTLELVTRAGISAGTVEESLHSLECEGDVRDYTISFRQYREI